MEITNLKDKDLSALDGLFTQFWGESSDIHKMSEMFERLSRDKDYVLLAARQKDVLVGFCMVVVCQSLYGDCSPFMVVEDFIVDEQCRRTGIGTALMSSAEQYAIGRGCSQVILVTENDREDAHRFYESQGYSPGGHKGFKKQLGGQ
jgi:GNAT superfamily N-acetyltransferase